MAGATFLRRSTTPINLEANVMALALLDHAEGNIEQGKEQSSVLVVALGRSCRSMSRPDDVGRPDRPVHAHDGRGKGLQRVGSVRLQGLCHLQLQTRGLGRRWPVVGRCRPSTASHPGQTNTLGHEPTAQPEHEEAERHGVEGDARHMSVASERGALSPCGRDGVEAGLDGRCAVRHAVEPVSACEEVQQTAMPMIGNGKAYMSDANCFHDRYISVQACPRSSRGCTIGACTST
jgi:hypothetical protein